jgi:hypothetical protein
MSDQEVRLFESFVRCAGMFLEFGCGGSTVFAADRVGQRIISVDSSAEWTEKVSQACREGQTRIMPEMVAIDIGRTGDWGVPTDPSTRDRWPDYHTSVWRIPGASTSDLYLVDGRFRVACFLQILLHGRRDAPILFHDFASRPHYHVVRTVARQIGSSGDLAIFVAGDRVEDDTIRALLERYRYVFD